MAAILTVPVAEELAYRGYSLRRLAFGALAMKTEKLGEAIAAHGTTNALLAIYVLMFDQWRLW